MRRQPSGATDEGVCIMLEDMNDFRPNVTPVGASSSRGLRWWLHAHLLDLWMMHVLNPLFGIKSMLKSALLHDTKGVFSLCLSVPLLFSSLRLSLHVFWPFQVPLVHLSLPVLLLHL